MGRPELSIIVARVLFEIEGVFCYVAKFLVNLLLYSDGDKECFVGERCKGNVNTKRVIKVALRVSITLVRYEIFHARKRIVKVLSTVKKMLSSTTLTGLDRELDKGTLSFVAGVYALR